MRLEIDGLEVLFPYDYLYAEQEAYMRSLKKTLDQKGHGLIEMPTGTGKTVCLLALLIAYQSFSPNVSKVVYCTRTVPEMVKCMEEVKKVLNYRKKYYDSLANKDSLNKKSEDVLALCLSSRRNLCIHEKIEEEGDRETVDSLCRSMTASWMRNKVLEGRSPESSEPLASDPSLCEFFENYLSEGSNSEIPKGVYSLDDLKSLGRYKKWCPYYLARYLLSHANIVVFNYQYLLDPKVSNIVSSGLDSNSIVVFDEAHNIDNVCIEALSVTLTKKSIDLSMRGVNKLQSKVTELKESDAQKLKNEYDELVRGLAQTGARNNTIRSTVEEDNNMDVEVSASSSSVVPAGNASNVTPLADIFQSYPGAVDGSIITKEMIEETLPGSIRKADHFLNHLKKIIVYLKSIFINQKEVENKTPLAFLHSLQQQTSLERRTLKFTYTRLMSLLKTLEIVNLDDYLALQEVTNFITLMSSYLEGFAIIFEPNGSLMANLTEPLLQLACLDSSIAIRPVFNHFQSVIITSGTLSPLELYPKLLNFQPCVKVSLPMSTFRPCLLPLIVSRGNDQLAISTKFSSRNDVSVVRNYGHLIIDLCQTIPDGICCFFTSYSYMEYVLSEWNKMKILEKIMESKLIYIETKDIVETSLALDHYRQACDIGRGAIFFSVARGKVAEGIDFDRHYGRAVVLIGIPYQYTLSYVLKARLNFMREKFNVRDDDYLHFDAMRQCAQCCGRVIRSKTDYGIVILADSRFSRADKREKLPAWINQFLLNRHHFQYDYPLPTKDDENQADPSTMSFSERAKALQPKLQLQVDTNQDSNLHLSTDLAIEKIKKFLKDLGQPIDEKMLRTILYDEKEVREKLQKQYNKVTVEDQTILEEIQEQEQIQNLLLLQSIHQEKNISSTYKESNVRNDGLVYSLTIEKEIEEMEQIQKEIEEENQKKINEKNEEIQKLLAYNIEDLPLPQFNPDVVENVSSLFLFEDIY